ncbi:MAG: cytochrome C [Proteobacteria bacterium]|nr:cytochrome C [Pseudomonadota bacterium]
MIRHATALVLIFLLSAGAYAQDVTYRKHIRPLWEARCSTCHGAASPEGAVFDENKEKFAALSQGPRMDSYTALLSFVAWPDTGALMRRLDDGKSTADKKPGNMYVNLGNSEEERQRNLALFKQWVGTDAWTLKKPDAITKEELLRIKAKY